MAPSESIVAVLSPWPGTGGSTSVVNIGKWNNLMMHRKPRTIRTEDEKYMCHPACLHFSWNGFHEPMKDRWCTTLAKLSAWWQAGLPLVLHVSLLTTHLSPFSSTMNEIFGIFHYKKMLSVVHSVLEPIKVLPLFRSNDKCEYTNNGWKYIFPKDIKYNCWIDAKNSKTIRWNYEVHFSEDSICCLSDLISQLQKWSVSYGSNFFFFHNKRKFSWIYHFHNAAGFNSIKSNLSGQSLIYATIS